MSNDFVQTNTVGPFERHNIDFKSNFVGEFDNLPPVFVTNRIRRIHHE